MNNKTLYFGIFKKEKLQDKGLLSKVGKINYL